MGALAWFVSSCWNVFDFCARAVTVQPKERKSLGGAGLREGKYQGFLFFISCFKPISVNMPSCFCCYEYRKVEKEKHKRLLPLKAIKCEAMSCLKANSAPPTPTLHPSKNTHPHVRMCYPNPHLPSVRVALPVHPWCRESGSAVPSLSVDSSGRPSWCFKHLSFATDVGSLKKITTVFIIKGKEVYMPRVC